MPNLKFFADVIILMHIYIYICVCVCVCVVGFVLYYIVQYNTVLNYLHLSILSFSLTIYIYKIICKRILLCVQSRKSSHMRI